MKFKNDFMKLHLVFMILYVSTFAIGWFRGANTLLYKLHPIVGIGSVVIPLVLFIFLKNKRVVIQMIKSNFNYKGKPLVKAAKISTQIIIFYYLFSISTGFLLNNSLYTSFEMYTVLHNIHAASKIIVPLAVGTHVVARLGLKKGRVKKK